MRATGLCKISEITGGCFRVRHPLFRGTRCIDALSDAARFFELPVEAKRSLAIENSPHFRGYSEMRNERDWREQIHFGREEAARNGGPAYEQLRGPNLWPGDAMWRLRILDLIADLETAGRDILAELVPEVDVVDPYLLLKMICYQPTPTSRPGVAAHVDFSWITLLIQDETGGLQVQCSYSGEWMEVEPERGVLVVNAGEILEFASGGQYRAIPHRVVNRSGTQARVSLPFFFNPGLDSEVRRGVAAGGERDSDREHVHRVFSKTPDADFVFGEEEWKRKGLGIWCGACVGG